MSGIDQNQWLPRGTPVVNKYRMQHGDLDGRIGETDKTKRIAEAWVRDETIARRLVQTGFLSEYHLEYGNDYLEMRSAVYGHLDAKGNFSMFLPDGISDISVRNVERFFKKIQKEIGKTTENIVKRAMVISCSTSCAEVCEEMYANVYRESFETLRTETDSAAIWLQELLAKPEVEV